MMAKYIVMLVGCLALAVGCQQQRQPAGKMAFSGTLEMTEHQLGAKAAGRVSTLLVQEGDKVTAGQLIATLDRYEQARKDLERAQALFAQGGATAQDVEYAQLAMEDQQVVSPIDAVVLVKAREVGEMAQAGAPVVVIGDPKDQWVRVFIPEGAINRIRMGQKASLSFDGMTQTYLGHVRYIATKAEFTPRNVQTAEERVTQAFAVKVAADIGDLPAHAGVAVDVTFDNE